VALDGRAVLAERLERLLALGTAGDDLLGQLPLLHDAAPDLLGAGHRLAGLALGGDTQLGDVAALTLHLGDQVPHVVDDAAVGVEDGGQERRGREGLGDVGGPDELGDEAASVEVAPRL
jgi:hypothetical protein